MTRDETRFLLARLCAAYGRRQPDTVTIDEWARGLEHTPSKCAHAALDSLIADGNAGPNLATIIARARALDDTHRTAFVAPQWDGPTARGRQAIADAKQRLAAARQLYTTSDDDE